MNRDCKATSAFFLFFFAYVNRLEFRRLSTEYLKAIIDLLKIDKKKYVI